MAVSTANVTKEQIDTFVEMVACGAKLWEADIEVFGHNERPSQTVRNHASKVAAMPGVAERIERRRTELQEAEESRDAVKYDDSNCKADNITKDRLLAECDYVIQNSRPCIFKKLNGVPITNKDAANVCLKAIELSAKIIGAFEQEEKIDNKIEVVLAGDVEELSG
jgi:hypothetical protein